MRAGDRQVIFFFRIQSSENTSLPHCWNVRFEASTGARTSYSLLLTLPQWCHLRAPMPEAFHLDSTPTCGPWEGYTPDSQRRSHRLAGCTWNPMVFSAF
mmetsp:Transcript_36343/g.40136  ORF Transcript_36343/g.40136 Transcript_36343/m.40136 type:complete len:99 (+) Transcript_36343:301-597(+)